MAEYGGAPERARPLVITEDTELLDDVLRLCAAAGAEPQVHHTVPEKQGSWEQAPLIVVGADAAARCRGTVRRRGVVLVRREPESDPEVWRLAVDIGAEAVLNLPDDEGSLVDRLADAAEEGEGQAVTIGVIGGRGGAGASTLACALAVGAVGAGLRTTLIDGDPLGGGLDVLFGGEQAEGLRWPDFAASRGRVAGAALEESLPLLHGVRVLSWDRGEPVEASPDAMRSVLAAARRTSEAVIVDLPRGVDATVAEALAQLDLGLLVVPADLRSVAAARRVASTVRMVLQDVRAVVCGPYAGGFDEEYVADVIGIPLAGELPPDPSLLGDQEIGLPPGAGARGPLAVFCSRFWRQVLAADEADGSVPV